VTNDALATGENSRSGGKLAAMQPYFFPYLGYLQLMSTVDCWVIFDTPQYIRHGWVNRNRVLSPSKAGWKYIRIPLVKASRRTPIREMKIADTRVDWKTELTRILAYYQQLRAPFYEETMDFVATATRSTSTWLSEVLIETLDATVSHLGIEMKNQSIFSQLPGLPIEADHAGQWALKICQRLGATTYINLPGGRSIFQAEEFQAGGVELQFLDPVLSRYHQGSGPFLEGLSILDVLMWNGAEATSQLVNRYSIVS
jgi:hypothetical protein